MKVISYLGTFILFNFPKVGTLVHNTTTTYLKTSLVFQELRLKKMKKNSIIKNAQQLWYFFYSVIFLLFCSTNQKKFLIGVRKKNFG